MITKEQILLFLNEDNWFRPSRSDKTITITNRDGEKIQVSQSYYHTIGSTAKITIRVSDHGTYLNTWVRRINNPSQSLQNLSVVFSNEPVNFKRITQPIISYDSQGNKIENYLYFVVEQYVYRLENLSMKDFKKIVNRIKMLEQQGVFNDPLKKKPSKKANRTVLSPTDKYDNEIPNTTNPIHPRQTAVDANRKYEVDEFGNIIRDWVENKNVIRLTESDLKRIIIETLTEILIEST